MITNQELREEVAKALNKYIVGPRVYASDHREVLEVMDIIRRERAAARAEGVKELAQALHKSSIPAPSIGYLDEWIDRIANQLLMEGKES